MRAYEAFRAYRDLGPLRTLDKLADITGQNRQTIGRWSRTSDWVARAAAWDDEQHMIEDRERLEAIRSMHANHRTAARAVQAYALAALRGLDTESASPADVARLLDLGTRLERLTLTQSVEQLQRGEGIALDDPWTRLARELSDA
jgi:hypothetical protein